MNHKKAGRTLVLAAAVAMLAMGLQGCGGDDGISQDRLDQEIAKTAAAEKARMAAEAAKAKADKDRMAAEAAKTAADKATMEAKAATTAANKAKMEADAATAAAQNSPENARLKKAVEDAKAEVKRLTDAAKEAEMKAERAKGHAKAEKLLAALEAAQGRLFPSAGNPTPLDLTNALNSSSLTLTSSTLLAEYQGYKQDAMRPPEIGGGGGAWSGVRLSGNADGNDKIVIYSNQPAKKKFLRDVYTGKTLPGQPTGFVVTFDGNRNTIKHGTNNHPDVRGNSDLWHLYSLGHCQRFLSDTFGFCNSYAGGSPRGSFDTDRAGNYTATSSQSTIFNVLGPKDTMGKLVCQGDTSGSQCGLTRRDGVPAYGEPHTYDLRNPANWVFIPDDGKDFFYEPYVYFGWWMNEAPPAGSEAFEVFYGAIDPRYTRPYTKRRAGGSNRVIHADHARRDRKRAGTSNADTNPAEGAEYIRGPSYTAKGSDIAGTATYTGGAAGRYAIRALGEANTQAGAFVADMTLSVNFDVDTPGGSSDTDSITFSGAINNFRADYAGSNKWVVTLSADKDTTAAGVQPFLRLDETATNTVFKTEWRVAGNSIPIAEGQWKADYYGGTSSEAPDTAVGMFAASASNLSYLLGAFGAEKQKGSGQ